MAGAAGLCHFRTFTTDQVAGPKRRGLLFDGLEQRFCLSHAHVAVCRSKRALSVRQGLRFLTKAG